MPERQGTYPTVSILGSYDRPKRRFPALFHTRVANFDSECGRAASWGPQDDARSQRSGTGAGRRGLRNAKKEKKKNSEFPTQVVYMYICTDHHHTRTSHIESTCSRQLTEVKRYRAWLVLRWVTTLESRVASFLFALLHDAAHGRRLSSQNRS